MKRAKAERISRDEWMAWLTYNAVSGEFIWAKDVLAGMGMILRPAGSRAGSVKLDGYRVIQITINAEPFIVREHRLAWLFAHGEWPSLIDHINGDRADNRLDNLRVVTRSQNSANTKPNAANTSGIKGVRQDRRSGRWYAAIKAHGKYHHLGTFSDKEEAGQAYRAAALRYFGAFARTT